MRVLVLDTTNTFDENLEIKALKQQKFLTQINGFTENENVKE